MVLSTLNPAADADDMIPYRLQEHVAQVLSLLKMRLLYLDEVTGNEEIPEQMPEITELLSRCIHTLRDLHTIEVPGAFHEIWMDQLSLSILGIQQNENCQMTMFVEGDQGSISHQQSIILYRVLLTLASHIIFLCDGGSPELSVGITNAGVNASFSNLSFLIQPPTWMQQSLDFLKHQAAIINAELEWSFSEDGNGNRISLKLAH